MVLRKQYGVGKPKNSQDSQIGIYLWAVPFEISTWTKQPIAASGHNERDTVRVLFIALSPDWSESTVKPTILASEFVDF